MLEKFCNESGTLNILYQKSSFNSFFSKNGPSRPLFCLSKQALQVLQQRCVKNVHMVLGFEPTTYPPITTRPGLDLVV